MVLVSRTYTKQKKEKWEERRQLGGGERGGDFNL
jgi:hypothetical protein